MSILCFLSWALAECKSFDFCKKRNKNQLIYVNRDIAMKLKAKFTQSVVYLRWKFGSPMLCTNAANFGLLSNFSKNSMNISSCGKSARISSSKPFKPPIVVFVPINCLKCGNAFKQIKMNHHTFY